MNLELSQKQFRRLLDLVYIGNWILNSTRGDQRFTDYDEVESLLFGRAALEGMPALAELYQGEIVPSRAFVEGGIHEAIMEYENNVFFDILAEDLARRDMDKAVIPAGADRQRIRLTASPLAVPASPLAVCRKSPVFRCRSARRPALSER